VPSAPPSTRLTTTLTLLFEALPRQYSSGFKENSRQVQGRHFISFSNIKVKAQYPCRTGVHSIRCFASTPVDSLPREQSKDDNNGFSNDTLLDVDAVFDPNDHSASLS